MKKRLTYLGCFFASILGYFLLQKPVFMLYNGACEKGTAFIDYLRVLFHGFTLDAATTGYLTANQSGYHTYLHRRYGPISVLGI